EHLNSAVDVDAGTVDLGLGLNRRAGEGDGGVRRLCAELLVEPVDLGGERLLVEGDDGFDLSRSGQVAPQVRRVEGQSGDAIDSRVTVNGHTRSSGVDLTGDVGANDRDGDGFLDDVVELGLDRCGRISL